MKLAFQSEFLLFKPNTNENGKEGTNNKFQESITYSSRKLLKQRLFGLIALTTG